VSHTLAFLVAAVRTVTTYAVVGLYVLVVGPPGIALALLLDRPIVLYRAGVYGARLLLALSGIRYEVAGPGRVLDDRAAIYCLNHTSNLETPVFYLVVQRLFPHVQIIYKKSLRRLPILGRCFEVGGFVPIDRHDRAQSDRAIAQAAENLRRGKSFLVFPEGTRSRSGELLPFKKGPFVLAVQSQAPIVPVALIGAGQAMRRGSPVIWPATITVRLGRPIETAGSTYADRDRLMEETRSQIAALLAAGPEAGSEAARACAAEPAGMPESKMRGGGSLSRRP
jgi:1-acyl-sn-glycerol-3-phosphate acyltransferase